MKLSIGLNLKGEGNFVLWETKIENQAQGDGSDMYLKPGEHPEEENEIKKEKRLRAIIFHNLADDIQLAVRRQQMADEAADGPNALELESAHGLWKYLHTRYQDKENSQKWVLIKLKEFRSATQQRSEPIKTFAGRVETAAMEAMSVGATVTEFEICMVILNGTTAEELDNTVSNVTAMLKPQTANTADVLRALEQEEARQAAKKSTTGIGEDTALVVKELRAELKEMRALVMRGGDKYSNMTCWNCQQKGHSFFNCKQPRTADGMKRKEEFFADRAMTVRTSLPRAWYTAPSL